ncbi:MAG: hypothetical protein WAK98_09070 [Gemmobacter sp.]
MTAKDERPEVLLQGVPVFASQSFRIADRQTAMITHEVQQSGGQFRQAA